MHNLIEQYELERESQFVFENIEPKITGRIYKVIKGPNASYMWTISHFCKIEKQNAAYIPSAPFGQTIDEAELKLLQYVQRFNKAVDWMDNKYF